MTIVLLYAAKLVLFLKKLKVDYKVLFSFRPSHFFFMIDKVNDRETCSIGKRYLHGRQFQADKSRLQQTTMP